MLHDATSLQPNNVVWFKPHHTEGEVRVMNNVDDLTQEQMAFLFTYHPETGVFIWNINAGKNVRAGSSAGHVKNTRSQKNGVQQSYRYLRFTVDGKKYETVASRAAWLFGYGRWPNQRIRHKDGDTQNLRLDNLYEATTIYENDEWKAGDGATPGYSRSWRNQNPLAAKDSELRSAFGIGLAEYGDMLVAQNGVCAICRNAEKEERNDKRKALAVDHDHVTGGIRGLLCSACNTGIGKFGDDPAILRAAADYLDRCKQKEAA